MKRVLIRIAAPVLYFALGFAMVRLGSPPQIDVTWETASEVDTAGFLIYRSDSPDGPFSPITETPVPARGDPLVGASYQHEDRGLVWGQRYFYRWEEVERDGSRNSIPDVVEGQAGAGYLWALAAGAVLAVVGGVAGWYGTRPGGPRSTGGSQPP